ncbi:MAG: LysR family transcriptional regulator [Phaeovulum sp.]|uniref:LysR family transcriptional regulator n=1 Tax=Phaeovulum sp. TaxID=2934796 RepID=UPI0027331A32|nr:LysR family transcriptional regulator [Phaeovulum sp.]MDP3862585.1 LysR family transcriptional regulator [Phaeovulum sp.]
MKALATITLKQLRALAGVSESGSITAAAKALNLTGPAVHSQIKALEQQLGAALLHRSADSAGSQLTAAGAALLRTIERMDAVLSHGIEQVRALQSGEMGRITLGVVSTAKYFAPGLVKTLRLLNPGITIVLNVGNRDAILRDIEAGAVDLVIMGRPPRYPVVEAIPLGAHPHGIVAPPDHPLAGRKALSWADLRGETFIAREAGSGTRILMQRYLDQLGDGETYQTAEMASNETIKQAVMAGLGIAFLSLHTVISEMRHGELVLLQTPNAPVSRHWFLVHAAGRHLEPAAERTRDAIQRLGGSFLPAYTEAGVNQSETRGRGS